MAMRTEQNALSVSAELVAAAAPQRVFLEIKNADAAISIYIGSSSSVTTATGHLLKAGESISFSNMPDAVYAIAASGTPTITLVEWTR